MLITKAIQEPQRINPLTKALQESPPGLPSLARCSNLALDKADVQRMATAPADSLWC